MRSSVPRSADTAAAAIRTARRLVKEAWANDRRWERCHREARQVLEQALARQRDHVALMTCLGAVLSDQGQHRAARTLLLKAVARKPRDANAYFNLAVATLNLGRHSEADRYFALAGKFARSRTTLEAYFDPHGH